MWGLVAFLRGLIAFVTLELMASGAMAQPADCATRSTPGPSQRASINVAGRPGAPAGVTGKTAIEVPMQAPQTECGEPAAPADVLGGAPGDLLRGTSAPAER
jgi:hypothetical protein